MTLTRDNPIHPLLLALAVAGILALTAPLAAADDLRVAGDRLFVPVTINGFATEALLDSGAEMTLIDTALAQRLELETQGNAIARGTGGEQPVQFLSGVDIAAAGIALEQSRAVAIELSDIAARLVGEPVHVVLGRDLFDAGRFILDIEKRRFGPAPSDMVATGTSLPLRNHAGIKQLPIDVEGVATWADFDLGNGSEVLIGRDFAGQHGLLSPDRIIGRDVGGGIGGPIERDLVRLGTVTIAGTTFTDVAAAIDATANAATANVGVSLLRRFVMTIDFPGDAIWLQARDVEAGVELEQQR